jgi:flagellar basal body-associated protein FliL
MSDDTPTQRFDQPPTTPTGTQPPTGEKNPRRLLIILIVVGAVLLIAIIVIIALLIGRGGTTTASTASPTPTITHSASATPTPTPTPTPSPSASKTTAPPPPSTAPTVASFTVNTTKVTCAASGGVQDPQLSFSWTSTNAAEAYFGVDTTNAQQNPFFGQALSPNGDSTSFPSSYNPFEYSCKAPSHTYTITVVGNGESASKTITVTNIGAK